MNTDAFLELPFIIKELRSEPISSDLKITEKENKDELLGQQRVVEITASLFRRIKEIAALDRSSEFIALAEEESTEIAIKKYLTNKNNLKASELIKIYSFIIKNKQTVSLAEYIEQDFILSDKSLMALEDLYLKGMSAEVVVVLKQTALLETFSLGYKESFLRLIAKDNSPFFMELIENLDLSKINSSQLDFFEDLIDQGYGEHLLLLVDQEIDIYSENNLIITLLIKLIESGLGAGVLEKIPQLIDLKLVGNNELAKFIQKLEKKELLAFYSRLINKQADLNSNAYLSLLLTLSEKDLTNEVKELLPENIDVGQFNYQSSSAFASLLRGKLKEDVSSRLEGRVLFDEEYFYLGIDGCFLVELARENEVGLIINFLGDISHEKIEANDQILDLVKDILAVIDEPSMIRMFDFLKEKIDFSDIKTTKKILVILINKGLSVEAGSYLDDFSLQELAAVDRRVSADENLLVSFLKNNPEKVSEAIKELPAFLDMGSLKKHANLITALLLLGEQDEVLKRFPQELNLDLFDSSLEAIMIVLSDLGLAEKIVEILPEKIPLEKIKNRSVLQDFLIRLFFYIDPYVIGHEEENKDSELSKLAKKIDCRIDLGNQKSQKLKFLGKAVIKEIPLSWIGFFEKRTDLDSLDLKQKTESVFRSIHILKTFSQLSGVREKLMLLAEKYESRHSISIDDLSTVSDKKKGPYLFECFPIDMVDWDSVKLGIGGWIIGEVEKSDSDLKFYLKIDGESLILVFRSSNLGESNIELYRKVKQILPNHVTGSFYQELVPGGESKIGKSSFREVFAGVSLRALYEESDGYKNIPPNLLEEINKQKKHIVFSMLAAGLGHGHMHDGNFNVRFLVEYSEENNKQRKVVFDINKAIDLAINEKATIMPIVTLRDWDMVSEQ